MKFILSIHDPKRALEFVNHLSAFGVLDSLIVREETEEDMAYLPEVEALMKSRLKIKETKSLQTKVSNLKELLAQMSEEEKQEAREEQEGVRRMSKMRALAGMNGPASEQKQPKSIEE